jgi:signal transduction histidine kinase
MRPRRIALERARDTGAIAATGRIQLVQETAGQQYSFLMFVPVYGQPAQTPRARRQYLEGYVLGVFRVADVVEEALTDLDTDINFYILDQTARSPEQLLGFYDAQTQQVMPQQDTATVDLVALCTGGSDCSQRINLGQREWQLVFERSLHRALPWGTLATLAIGLLLTATLLIYLARWQAELSRTRELSDLKLRLFSMASHELRTPLSVVTVSAQSLATNRDNLTLPQQIRTVERIQLAAKRMGQLVSDILTLARAEAGKLEFSPEIVVLEPFCQQVLDQIPLKPEQTLTLTGVPARFQAYIDKLLLQSILLNLLSNAVKYSPAGSEICLAIAPQAETLTFKVTDQGIGIPAEAREQIFEAFDRGQNVGPIPGTGLGLAVVKTCVELHGGHLAVESTPDQGTCISVILPRIE